MSLDYINACFLFFLENFFLDTYSVLYNQRIIILVKFEIDMKMHVEATRCFVNASSSYVIVLGEVNLCMEIFDCELEDNYQVYTW